jgi:6-pyruvoyltetrahydropterin/6-carboxytetrahydropterin synthase
LDLIRKASFSAAHHYRLPHLAPDEAVALFGAAARTIAHGHDYEIEATVRGDVDPKTGMVINIKELKDLLHERVVSLVENRLLNDEVEAFRARPPTLEEIARWSWERLAPAIRVGRLHRVRVAETARLFIENFGDASGREHEHETGHQPKGVSGLFLTCVYDFSASHRLHSAALSAEENGRVFGKCNNPNGHGHNYVLEVTVTGPLDARTGTIASLSEIDALVEENVVRAFDHKNLNLDVADFRDVNPTAENIARAIWRRLDGRLSRGAIHKVRLVETARNAVEYWGDEDREPR